ncbi:MAG: hypothetical protein HY300_09835 [Verrucomicrobia bacterium]|nr:hypothetical protein [Verrucomicrobiota bacterium]
MNLNDSQKAQVAGWIEAGLKLADIQKKLADDLNLHLTYMEVRFLVDDLKLVPKDPPPPPEPKEIPAPAPKQAAPVPAAGKAPTPQPAPQPAQPDAGAPAAPSKLALTVDKVTRPGAMVSGNVTFSDGMTALWYLDQYGRMGVVPKQQGYKPSAADVEQFQLTLESELAKLGY